MKKSARKFVAGALCGVMLVTSFTGCGAAAKNSAAADIQAKLDSATSVADVLDAAYVAEGETIDIAGDDQVPLGDAPISTTIMPKATGTQTYGNSSVIIDASNTSSGYIMIKYLAQTSKALKVIIKGPDQVGYTYNINKKGDYETFPLSGGNGSYSVGIYENISGTSYSTVFSTSFSVNMKDSFAPYLLPNQYVNYTADCKTVQQAKQLTAGCATELDKVAAVYSYVVKNFTYDKEKAATVKSGYLPDVDQILAAKKGICFDYAAVMAAMLRSQGIPCKLVVGYAGTAYHAWISTYISGQGWVDGVIYFDGTSWKRMDPTFASSAGNSDAIKKYIGDGANYNEKYLY